MGLHLTRTLVACLFACIGVTAIAANDIMDTRHIAIAGTGGFVYETCDWPDAGALRAVVPVAAEDGSYASGVVVDTNRVLTAAHALNPGQHVFVSVEGHFRRARVIGVDEATDLAILAVDTASIKPMKIASAELSRAQQVWAVGYPRASGMATSAGVFTRQAGVAVHTSAPIDQGHSGGGLLQCANGSYELAGMLRGYGAYLSDGRYVRVKNHSVSVAAATIQQFVTGSSF